MIFIIYFILIMLFWLISPKSYELYINEQITIFNRLLSLWGIKLLIETLYHFYSIEDIFLKKYVFINTLFGENSFYYWLFILFAIVLPQFFWFKRYRNRISLIIIVLLALELKLLMSISVNKNHDFEAIYFVSEWQEVSIILLIAILMHYYLKKKITTD